MGHQQINKHYMYKKSNDVIIQSYFTLLYIMNDFHVILLPSYITLYGTWLLNTTLGSTLPRLLLITGIWPHHSLFY